MGIKTVMFPDTSDVLDTPMTGKYFMYPKGGVTMEALRTTGESKATLALGEYASGAAGKLLDTKCKVPLELHTLPIGLEATDRFVDALRRLAGVSVPETLNDERGRLVDFMSDMHQYTSGKTVALAGDPDQLIALTEFLIALDMVPKYIVTGTPGKLFDTQMAQVLKGKEKEVRVKSPGDLFHLHQWIKQEKVDLLIGGTHLKHIARDEDIPLLRFGFPILDRQGHNYFPTVGYNGALRLLEKILGLLMDRQDRDAPNEKFELIL